ncbi:MAG TPA: bifunctional methylenetetrahydrofolate dehydrogenase/methenyltetrahydrofolate cyclohydrolase FolD [Burkholderiales bacterium]
MTARIIDGKAIAQKVREELKGRIANLARAGIVPGLDVVIVGENPASQVYVRNKANTSREIGIRSRVHTLPADTAEAALLYLIADLNRDPSVHGILVQLPLPAHIRTAEVLEAIDPAKDVDGFHLHNVGALVTGSKVFVPCTPYGVMRMLREIAYSVEGAEAVVVGRSNIVGKPMAFLLLEQGATVTLCTSKTRDLAGHTRRADILVVATGKAHMVTGDMVKPGAVVIDVGINRLPDGKLTGDVDFESAKQRAGWITPVPGGVGPMTIAMLLCNTVEAAERVAAAATPSVESQASR